MSNINSPTQVISQPAVSSLSGNAAAYGSNTITPVTGLLRGGKRRSKGRKTKKAKKGTKRTKTAKKSCWWKLF